MCRIYPLIKNKNRRERQLSFKAAGCYQRKIHRSKSMLLWVTKCYLATSYHRDAELTFDLCKHLFCSKGGSCMLRYGQVSKFAPDCSRLTSITSSDSVAELYSCLYRDKYLQTGPNHLRTPGMAGGRISWCDREWDTNGGEENEIQILLKVYIPDSY